MDIVQNALRTSLRALVSKQAQRAYLGTVLFIATSLLMICVSSVAYGMFYFKFIPQVGFERVVHLQFGYVAATLPCTPSPALQKQVHC